MRDLSFFDKLKVLVDVSSSSGISIVTIFILVFLAIMMFTTNKKNSKQTKLFCTTIYIVLVVVMLVKYSSSLSTMFDYMMNNLFIVIYFPNLAVYLAAIIATNIILLKTIFNFKEDKLLKIVNVVIYTIMHYLLVLILNIVTSNELNVFDNSSVYGNNDALALIGLSSTVFIIWVIFMIIYKIIRGKQKVGVVERVRQKEVVKNRLPSNIIEVAVPKVVKEVVKIKEEIVPKVVEQTSLIDFYKQRNEEIQKYDSILTLEDYKTVLAILNHKNNSIDMSINKGEDLSPKNSDQEIMVSSEENTIDNNYLYYDDVVEQPKLDQLLNLYKSV